MEEYNRCANCNSENVQKLDVPSRKWICTSCGGQEIEKGTRIVKDDDAIEKIWGKIFELFGCDSDYKDLFWQNIKTIDSFDSESFVKLNKSDLDFEKHIADFKRDLKKIENLPIKIYWDTISIRLMMDIQ